MTTILLHFIIFKIILLSNGLIIKKIFFKNFEFNFAEILFIGIVFTGFLSYFLQIFIPLSDRILVFNLLVSIGYIFFFWKEIFFLKINYKLYLPLFFLSLFQIYGSSFSDDLAHYHASMIINLDNFNLIIGYNFLHNHFGINSIWLYLHSYLNFNKAFLQDIHVLNAILFLLILYYFMSELLKDYKNNSYIFLSIIVLFLLLKYTRLKEFGLDRPGTIIFFIILFFYLKYESIAKFQNNKFLFLLLIFCLFLLSLKSLYIFCFLIPIYFFVNYKIYNFLLSKEIIIITFIFFIFIIKNIFISGCAVYPLYFSCFDLPWSNLEATKELYNSLIAHTKGYDKFGIIETTKSREEFIKNFFWLSSWFKNVKEDFIEIILNLILILFLIMSFLKFKRNFNLKKFQLLLLLLIVGNFITFYNAPVIRYHHGFFILLFIFCTCLLFNFRFRKSIFFLFALAFIFNFGKNITRIYNVNFINDPIYLIKKINWYRVPQEKKLDSFTYYLGWIDAYPLSGNELNGIKYKKSFIFNVLYRSND